MLFSIALENVMRDAELETKGTTDKSTQYARDMDIVGRRVSSVKETFPSPSAVSKTMRLKANEEKTKLMQVTSSKTEIGSYNFEEVQTIKYFKTIMRNENNIDRELRNRIILANKC
jgi:hypothetical protein